jgi:hypothetical protein
LPEEFDGAENPKNPKDTKTPLLDLPQVVSAGPSGRLSAVRVFGAAVSAGTASAELQGLESG